ncbi:hypothetical protein NQ176_g4235 [Zarea fungicola]|uniref:Uncharacterized protein n=1 Tax=Zarea fungicola TaxID=93591 RepID=A0ACC1NGN5_9HYPO|nr:hypothetical protein NQ176_g4235 [Lecanicillium fungicola]
MEEERNIHADIGIIRVVCNYATVQMHQSPRFTMLDQSRIMFRGSVNANLGVPTQHVPSLTDGVFNRLVDPSSLLGRYNGRAPVSANNLAMEQQQPPTPHKQTHSKRRLDDALRDVDVDMDDQDGGGAQLDSDRDRFIGRDTFVPFVDMD